MDTPGLGSRILARLLILDVTGFNTPTQREAARAGAVTPVAAVGGDVLAEALMKTGLVFIDDVPLALIR